MVYTFRHIGKCEKENHRNVGISYGEFDNHRNTTVWPGDCNICNINKKQYSWTKYKCSKLPTPWNAISTKSLQKVLILFLSFALNWYYWCQLIKCSQSMEGCTLPMSEVTSQWSFLGCHFKHQLN